MFESLVRRFLYHPSRLRRDAPLPPWAPEAQECWPAAGIHGLYWPPRRGRPTLLFLHGNAQSVFEWALVRQDLTALDCGLLLVDYPGYGKSPGRAHEAGCYAAAEAGRAWLASAVGVAPSTLVVMGKSLGGAVATHLVLAEQEAGRPVAGLILESTFTDLPAVARRIVPLAPLNRLLGSERFESAARLARITAALLVVHGEADELIPAQMGRSLADCAAGPCERYFVPGAGHNDVAAVAGRAYGQHLRAWLNGLS